MKIPTGVVCFLIAWAVGASTLSWRMMDQFFERANLMNDLTHKLANFEVVYGCLGKEIDDIFWIDGCPASYGNVRTARVR